MSNVNVAVGNAIIRRAAEYGLELYVNPGSNQVLTRNNNTDPSRTIPQQLISDINNNRGAIAIALAPKSAEQIFRENNAARALEIQQAAERKVEQQEHERLHGSGKPVDAIAAAVTQETK